MFINILLKSKYGIPRCEGLVIELNPTNILENQKKKNMGFQIPWTRGDAPFYGEVFLKFSHRLRRKMFGILIFFAYGCRMMWLGRIMGIPPPIQKHVSIGSFGLGFQMDHVTSTHEWIRNDKKNSEQQTRLARLESKPHWKW